MKEFFIKNWLSFVIASLMVVCIGFLIPIALGSGQPSEIEVSIGDASIKVGTGEDAKILPMEGAIGQLCDDVGIIKNDFIELKIQVNNCTSYNYKSIIRQVDKQYGKIHKSPDDVKMCDIQYLVEDWTILPEKYRDPPIVMKYESIESWYRSRL